MAIQYIHKIKHPGTLEELCLKEQVNISREIPQQKIEPRTEQNNNFFLENLVYCRKTILTKKGTFSH